VNGKHGLEKVCQKLPETLFSNKFEGYLNQTGNFNKKQTFMTEQDEIIESLREDGNE